MAVFITDECILCGVCEPECPRGCISFGGEKYEVDPFCCTECWEEGSGPSCAKVCPADCIFPLDFIDIKNATEIAQKKKEGGKTLDPMLLRLGIEKNIPYLDIPTDERKQQIER